MKLYTRLISIGYCILISLTVIARKTDTLPDAYKEALSVYHSLLSPETGLYKGNEYIDYSYFVQEGTPFFDTVAFSRGSVVYHNIQYENLLMAYDIVKGEVVIYDAPRQHTLSLNKDQISRFTKAGYSFVHLTKDSAGASRMKSGFYEVLYTGRIRMLKKETRTVQEAISSQNTLKYFITTLADYFIEKNDVYYPVHNKSSLLAVLKDKGKELQPFIRKKRLKFRRNKDSDFTQVCIFYDTVKK